MSDIALSTSTRLEAVAEPSDRLDRFLAQQFPEFSRARFQSLIAEGMVTVEGKAAQSPRLTLKGGERVLVRVPAAVAAEPVPETIPLVVVHEDDELIVIDKPAGLVVHPAAGHETGTLVNALIAHCGDSLSGIGGVKRPGIVHRLDKDTSGLLVVAKTDRAHKALSEQFAAHGRDGRLQREYLALVWGTPERPQGTVSAALNRSTSNRQKIAVSRSPEAREAITHYQVEATFGQPPVASLLRCHLETGRTHQIRVHMAHIGHPLLGDGTYGSGFKASTSKLPEAARIALKTLNRQALHAAVLGFEHPRNGRPMLFTSPLPEDFSELLVPLQRL